MKPLHTEAKTPPAPSVGSGGLLGDSRSFMMNTNRCYVRVWWEVRADGCLHGMRHVREVAMSGKVIRDETGPTGTVGRYA